MQIGPNSDSAIWQNTGPFNAATAVSVNGQFQNVWNADTKLDSKVGTGFGDSDHKYAYSYDHWTDTDTVYRYIWTTGTTEIPSGEFVPLYHGGKLSGNDPKEAYEYANKRYVDEKLAQVHRIKLTSTDGTNWVSEGQITGNKACMICLTDNPTAPRITIPANATTSYLASYAGDNIVTNISLGTYKFNTGFREYEEREIKATIETLMDWNDYSTKIHVTTDIPCNYIYDEEYGSSKQVKMLILC